MKLSKDLGVSALRAYNILSLLAAKDSQGSTNALSTLSGYSESGFDSITSWIDSLSQRTSCFASAIRVVADGCATLSQDLAESQRARYAVALTLCELASAGLPSPQQCQDVRSEKNLKICTTALEHKSQWLAVLQVNARMLNW